MSVVCCVGVWYVPPFGGIVLTLYVMGVLWWSVGVGVMVWGLLSLWVCGGGVLYSLVWSYLYVVQILTGGVFGGWGVGGVWVLCFSLCGGVCVGCGRSFSVSLCGYGLKGLFPFFLCAVWLYCDC